jgi:hypothetical protein
MIIFNLIFKQFHSIDFNLFIFNFLILNLVHYILNMMATVNINFYHFQKFLL